MEGLGNSLIQKGKMLQLIELVEAGMLSETDAAKAAKLTLEEFRKEIVRTKQYS